MTYRLQLARTVATVITAVFACLSFAAAFERVTLRNGSEFDCVRRETQGNKLRLYFKPTSADAPPNYLDIAAESVLRIESLPDLPTPVVLSKAAPATAAPTQPTFAELHEMLAHAGAQHHIDAELLASVVHAESGGHIHAVSRTGARGLMQLMPATAAALGVQDSFAPTQNVEGGTKYLDALLIRYHDNIALALAAYNAGPGSVDRYHGIPPYRETRAYVARIIRDFNHRKTILLAQAH